MEIIDIKDIPKRNKCIDIKKYRKESYQNNKEYFKEKHKNYRKEHKEQLNKYSKNYHNEHKEYRNKYQKEYFRLLRIKVLKKYGSKCANPYNINHGNFLNDIRCLQIDHVNGNGSKERKNIMLSLFLKKVLADKEGNYQLLCANCNFIKKHINNEVPKK
jgi:transketolase